MMNHRHSLAQSFGFAFEGLKTTFLTGRNFRIQTLAMLTAIILGIMFKISPKEWIDLVLISSIVLILELINTSIEAIVDIVSPEVHPKAKIAKDVSAGSVLVAAIAAVFIAAFLFIPKILS